MKRKIGVFDSGFHQRNAFSTLDHPITFLPLNNLKGNSLFFFDVVVITNFSDQYALDDIKTYLERFLERDGILIIFRATDLNSLGWIPYCQWNGTGKWPVECHVESSINNNYAEILNGLKNPGDFKYHSTYTGHGTLNININDKTFHVLLRAEDERIIMLVRDHPTYGTLLVTTLDPDYHSISQTPGPSNKETPIAVGVARQLLNNILNWAMASSMTKPKIWRRLEGLLRKAFRIIGSVIIFSAPALFLYWFKPSDQPFLEDIYQYLGAMTIWIALIEYFRNIIFKNKTTK